ncbi:MAG: hypothetical protein ACJ0P6_00520 [Flavobacteriaceae bacterium]
MRKIYFKRTANTKNDILSGLIVALALVPEAMAFALENGLSEYSL